MRISPAVPATPMTMMGTQRWLMKSISLPKLHSAVTYFCENRPPIDTFRKRLARYIMISANRKLGIDSPRKPTKVTALSDSEYWRVAE